MSPKEEVKEESKAKPKLDVNMSIVHHNPLVGDISLGRSWERRYQTLAMFSCSLQFLMPSSLGAWAFTLYYLLVGIWKYEELYTYQTIMASLMAIYLTFCFVVDVSPTTGSRTPILRNFRVWWSHSCDYLPLLLVKTADLPSDGKYILGYHPHGIISVGCFGAFATDGAKTMDLSKKKGKDDNSDNEKEDNKRGFSSLFPGLDRRVITLPQNFSTPFLREYFLSMGACTSAKETFRNILAKPSTAVVVVVGGAAESMHTKEGSLNLVLEKRRGFIREAILAKASLVPVIAFGENDLYEVFEADHNSWIGHMQDFVKRYVGFGMPIFSGRSMFVLNFGIMPQRKPVNVVVGAPIPPPNLEDYKAFAPQVDRKTDEAKNEDGEILKKHHAKYVEALETLYNLYKEKSWNVPGKHRRESMKIIRK